MSADPLTKLLGLLDAVEVELKQPETGTVLTERGVNLSLALVAASGLRAYLLGQKQEAADDLGTAAEEIAARLRKSREHLS